MSENLYRLGIPWNVLPCPRRAASLAICRAGIACLCKALSVRTEPSEMCGGGVFLLSTAIGGVGTVCCRTVAKEGRFSRGSAYSNKPCSGLGAPLVGVAGTSGGVATLCSTKGFGT